jgi:hypothetical protein
MGQMARLINNEEDPDQQASIVQTFHTFIQEVMKKTGQEILAPPKFELPETKAGPVNEIDDTSEDGEDGEDDRDTEGEDEEELEEEEITYTARKGGTKKKQPDSQAKGLLKLPPVKFALSEDMDIAVIQKARDKFLAAILKLETPIMKNNKTSILRHWLCG